MATEHYDFESKGEPICRQTDPDMFFPEPDDPQRFQLTKMAKQACSVCPYIVECLAGALERNESFGIWGGTTEQDRKRLRRGIVLKSPKW